MTASILGDGVIKLYSGAPPSPDMEEDPGALLTEIPLTEEPTEVLDPSNGQSWYRLLGFLHAEDADESYGYCSIRTYARARGYAWPIKKRPRGIRRKWWFAHRRGTRHWAIID